jgi:hypothetical protein
MPPRRHAVIRPETLAPSTPSELLEQILGRDDTPTSATTLLRELSDPAARLFDAVQRYTDGLHIAAELLVGPQIARMLDGQADQVVPELTGEPSWPTLRAHLLALAAETGEHPLLHLLTAASGRDIRTAADMAAVLDWRLPERPPTDPGPLPWLPGVPKPIQDHPVWGEYLARRSELIWALAAQVRGRAEQDCTPPVWAPPGSHLTATLIAEVAVWRAANGIEPRDTRPTGSGQLQTAPALWQQHLERNVALGIEVPGGADPRAHRARSRHGRPQERLLSLSPPGAPSNSTPPVGF